MYILFPHEPFQPTKVDSAFASECEAAKNAGFLTVFYDDISLQAGEVQSALKRLTFFDPTQKLILRGWMIPGERYTQLNMELEDRGGALITSPHAYEEAHYLPNAYVHIQSESARTEWIEGDDVVRAWRLYQGFQAHDAVIKDWVKSAKSRWLEGCFIPKDTSESRFREIYRVFREERGSLFNRGVVLREFLPIIETGCDIRGLPIVEETRLFFWKGELIVRPELASSVLLSTLGRWEAVARRFKSPFISIDVAELIDHTWKIVEVGDGGVSGLPAGLDDRAFFTALHRCVVLKQ